MNNMLGKGGNLSRLLPDFQERDNQKKMFADILSAYENDQKVLIEAGTGIGKSIAYLLPALIYAIEKGEKTVISTHTIALQEQLVKKDLPLLLQACGVTLNPVLVKGMSNYVCLKRVHDLPPADDDVEALLQGLKGAQSGCRTEFRIGHALWEKVRAERESCIGQRCSHYKECFLFKARKKAEEASIIVVNHHLLFADLAIRERTSNWNESCILPIYNRLILDEAHHLEEVATHRFAKRASDIAIYKLLSRLHNEKGAGKLNFVIDQLQKKSYDEKLLFRLEFEVPFEKRELTDKIYELFHALKASFSHSTDEEKIRLNLDRLQSAFWQEKIIPLLSAIERQGKSFLATLFALHQEPSFVEIEPLLRRIEEELSYFSLFKHQIDGLVYSVERRGEEISLVATPLEISSMLEKTLFSHPKTVILCSATLAPSSNFSFLKKRLGIKDAVEKIYSSPFDYENNAALFIPSDLPDPENNEFVERASQVILKAVTASLGGAFILFTSFAMLKEMQMKLESKIKDLGLTLLVQGEGSFQTLVTRFRADKNAILFGTDSLWEGVDVIGKALRLVVIVKLPFKVPTDPLSEARAETITAAKGSAFFEYFLPSAVMKFKQGFGRLIRGENDRGIILCLDRRLVTKGYGKAFLKSLPSLLHYSGNEAQVIEKMKEFYEASKTASCPATSRSTEMATQASDQTLSAVSSISKNA